MSFNRRKRVGAVAIKLDRFGFCYVPGGPLGV